AQEIVYGVSGRGTIVVDGEEHELETGTGVYVAAGESYEIENPGPRELMTVSAVAPQTNGAASAAGSRTVRLADQPVLPPGAGREFPYLVTDEAGWRCMNP